MLKIKFLYSLLFLFMATVLFSSCRKIIDPSLDPENPDFLAIDLLVDINLRPEAKYFLVLENKETPAVYYDIPQYFGYAVTRGTWLRGNTFNLHFIKIDELVDGTLEIKSFFDVPVGVKIDIRDNNLKKASASKSNFNLSFTNIPDFDIVTRSAKNQEQSFTLDVFSTPATTPELGGETFGEQQLFYACFQKGNTAAYMLERMPIGISDYTVDFSNLSTDLAKYSFSKNKAGATIVHADVQAWNNRLLKNQYVEIFNLNNFDLYPASTFDIFVPKYLIDMRFFIQNYGYEKSESKYYNWAFSGDLMNSLDLLDLGLTATSRIGRLPLIETTNENYDEAQIIFESENFKWTMHGPSASSFYIPNIPKEVYDNFPEPMNLQQLFLSQEKGIVKLIDYSDFDEYNQTLPLYLSDTTIFKLGSYYRTEEQEFSIK